MCCSSCDSALGGRARDSQSKRSLAISVSFWVLLRNSASVNKGRNESQDDSCIHPPWPSKCMRTCKHVAPTYMQTYIYRHKRGKREKAHSLGPQSPLCSTLSNPCQDAGPWKKSAWHPGVPAGESAFCYCDFNFLLCSLVLGCFTTFRPFSSSQTDKLA